MSGTRSVPMLALSFPLHLFLQSEDAAERFRYTGESTARPESLRIDDVSVSRLLRPTKLVESCRRPYRRPACQSWPPSPWSEASSGPSLYCEGEEALSRPRTLAEADIDKVPVIHDKSTAPAAHPAKLPLQATHGKGQRDVAGDATDKLIYSAIREILREDAAFAEEVVNAVKHLVGSGRRVVYSATHGNREETAGTGITETSPTSQAATSNTANSSSNFASSSSSSSSSGARKKRRLSSDDPDDPNRRRPKSPKTEGSSSKPTLLWPCPYRLVFGTMPPRFDTCRWRSRLTSRDAFRNHLYRVHCDNPDPGGENDQYYMSPAQLEGCKAVFKDASSSRPRTGDPRWEQAQTAVFHRIWRVLFQPDFFITTCMEPPSCPFGPEQPQLRPLLDQVKILFCALQYVDAARAAANAHAAPGFQPTKDDIRQNVQRAFAIVAEYSDKEQTKKYLQAAEQECIEAAVQDPLRWLKGDDVATGDDDSMTNNTSDAGSEEPPQSHHVLSMRCSASDAKSIAYFLQIMRCHPDYRPDRELYLEMRPALHQEGLLSSTINCGGGGNRLAPVATSSVIAVPATPTMKQGVNGSDSFSSNSKGKGIAGPDGPMAGRPTAQVGALYTNESAALSTSSTCERKEVAGFDSPLMQLLEDDHAYETLPPLGEPFTEAYPWPDNAHSVSGSHHRAQCDEASSTDLAFDIPVYEE
ncbi:hypothetical protein PG997_010062 [Apiospora hydei]|uniref:Uncharacterized protein n=1 Tax=Apiospora hydei TaxID=1337664 RepID=A0ABR1VVX5_9PEZI